MNPATFTRTAAAMVAENDARGVRASTPDWTACDGRPCRACVADREATPPEAMRIARNEAAEALESDAPEHFLWHLETALIWARGALEKRS